LFPALIFHVVALSLVVALAVPLYVVAWLADEAGDTLWVVSRGVHAFREGVTGRE
jgi:hypothetical protein